MTDLLRFYPDLPPSLNRLYYNIPGGGRGLVSKADAYKKRFVQWFSREIMLLGSFDSNAAYELRLMFVLQTVTNKGWPKKAKNRWKRIDTDGLLKLIVDAMFKTCGVDDSAIFIHQPMKVEGPTEGVGIRLISFDSLSLTEAALLMTAPPTLQGVRLSSDKHNTDATRLLNLITEEE